MGDRDRAPSPRRLRWTAPGDHRFDWFVESYPGSLQPGQLRMLQQRVRDWRARHPPDQQVFFEDRGARARRGIDFIDATDLGVTIAG